MADSGLSRGCLIANVDFLGEPDKAEERLQEALSDCREMGTDQLMIVPGQAMDNRKKRFRSLSRSAMLEEAVRFFARAVEEAGKQGITVGLEDTPQAAKPFCTAAEMKALLERVPGLKLIRSTCSISFQQRRASASGWYSSM